MGLVLQPGPKDPMLSDVADSTGGGDSLHRNIVSSLSPTWSESYARGVDITLAACSKKAAKVKEDVEKTIFARRV